LRMLIQKKSGNNLKGRQACAQLNQAFILILPYI
jgi:hypothetical protein